MEVTPLLIFGIIALIAVIYVLRGFKIIPQSETRVVERLGRYDRTLPSGINFIFPMRICNVCQSPKSIGNICFSIFCFISV